MDTSDNNVITINSSEPSYAPDPTTHELVPPKILPPELANLSTMAWIWIYQH